MRIARFSLSILWLCPNYALSMLIRSWTVSTFQFDLGCFNLEGYVTHNAHTVRNWRYLVPAESNNLPLLQSSFWNYQTPNDRPQIKTSIARRNATTACQSTKENEMYQVVWLWWTMESESPSKYVPVFCHPRPHRICARCTLPDSKVSNLRISEFIAGHRTARTYTVNKVILRAYGPFEYVL